MPRRGTACGLLQRLPPAHRHLGPAQGLDQRKVLTPNDFPGLTEVESRLKRFQTHYEQVARPFQWKFTRADLTHLMAKLAEGENHLGWAA